MKTKKPLKLRRANRSEWTPSVALKVGDRVIINGKTLKVRGRSR